MIKNVTDEPQNDILDFLHFIVGFDDSRIYNENFDLDNPYNKEKAANDI